MSPLYAQANHKTMIILYMIEMEYFKWIHHGKHSYTYYHHTCFKNDEEVNGKVWNLTDAI